MLHLTAALLNLCDLTKQNPGYLQINMTSPDGWRLVGYSGQSDDWFGYFGTAFVSDNYLAIVSRGTTDPNYVNINPFYAIPNLFLDAINDAQIFFGYRPLQTSSALSFAEKMIAANPFKTLLFTGHSLGGFLAQNLAVEYPSSYCIPFESPGIVPYIKVGDGTKKNYKTTLKVINPDHFDDEDPLLSGPFSFSRETTINVDEVIYPSFHFNFSGDILTDQNRFYIVNSFPPNFVNSYGSHISDPHFIRFDNLIEHYEYKTATGFFGSTWNFFSKLHKIASITNFNHRIENIKKALADNGVFKFKGKWPSSLTLTSDYHHKAGLIKTKIKKVAAKVKDYVEDHIDFCIDSFKDDFNKSVINLKAFKTNFKDKLDQKIDHLIAISHLDDLARKLEIFKVESFKAKLNVTFSEIYFDVINKCNLEKIRHFFERISQGDIHPIIGIIEHVEA